MRPRRGAIVAVFVLAALCASRVRAAPDGAGRLGAAQERFAAGEYAAAAELAGPLARDRGLPAHDRAEALRVYGLALFLVGLRGQAEAELLAYLRLEPDAHLDPALVPPDAIVFFEDVRARHAGELLRRRPRPRGKRSWLLNLVPPGGQFQNGDRARGWALLAGETLLLATNVTTYAVLSARCGADATCGDDPQLARTLRAVNLASGALLLGVYAYGVIDGFRRYQGANTPAEGTLSVVPLSGGAALVLEGRFR